MVVMEITPREFCQAFIDANRGNNFSTEALELLYDYFDDLSVDSGEPYMVDVIAICCEYDEYTPEELITNYSLDDDEPVLEQLQAATTVIGETSHGTIVFAAW